MPSFSLPLPRQLWRRLHSLVGITEGSLLMLIGLTGAVLSFRAEILGGVNPGSRHVAALAQPALTPVELLAAVQRMWPDRAVGTLAIGLLALALSGLYLRWPRRPLDWRAWLTFNTALRGSGFLWGLHAVIGTCALLLYLMLSMPGIYWAFDAVQERVDAWAMLSVVQARPAPRRRDQHAFSAVAIDKTWAAFEQHTRRSGGWREAMLRVQPGGDVPTTRNRQNRQASATKLA